MIKIFLRNFRKKNWISNLRVLFSTCKIIEIEGSEKGGLFLKKMTGVPFRLILIRTPLTLHALNEESTTVRSPNDLHRWFFSRFFSGRMPCNLVFLATYICILHLSKIKNSRVDWPTVRDHFSEPVSTCLPPLMKNLALSFWIHE